MITINNCIEDRTSVETITTIESAEKMVETANRIGGFFIKVVAKEGEPYKVINPNQDSGFKVTEAFVPEGRVIITAINTREHDTPDNLSRLWAEIK